MGIPTRDFRFLVRITPALAAVAEEAGELFCDKAESILRDALESENELRRDVASRFVLSGKGSQRGWTRNSGPALDGTEWEMEVGGSREPPLIDARPTDGDERSSE